MIDIKKLCFTYADSVRPSLEDVNLHVEGSEMVLITGPSGGGKSTLIRCLNGIVPHFYGGTISGSVVVAGLSPFKAGTKEMAEKVGMVFQDPENQILTNSVEREVAFGMEGMGLERSLMAKRVEEVLDTVGIDHLRKRSMEGLSGGEKQKVIIASVLALQPEILVLDEPTSSLDPKGAEEVLHVIRRLNGEFGTTILLIEHRIDRVIPFVDRIIHMDGGSVKFDGTPKSWVDFVAGLDYELPQMLDLGRDLKRRGFIGEIPLTVKEGRQALAPVFREHWSGTVSAADRLREKGRSIVCLDDVWHKYEDGTMGLRGVSLNVRQGEFLAIIGRNASGKSTLASHMNSILKPTKGTVRVEGIDIKNESPARLARTIGYVFQNPNMHLFADRVEEEVAFILNNFGFPEKEVTRRTANILNDFGLSHLKDAYPRDLSGGEKQRVALASVLVAEPKLVILDEPTRGLDSSRKNFLIEYLEQYNARGGTVVLISHDIELISRPCVERVILMSEGAIVADGPRRKILSKSLNFSPQINRLVQPFGQYGVPSDLLVKEEILCGLS
ncbi:MAG TPA: energy-coupling factor transporter ATPase [Methanothrix sp.]|uniref:ABC transporter ATP-binding protein n=1 Tax=Methanothrix sp. TaxID=90426 RepID=UPI002C4FE742|nr:energy-coupling factor transporter ATPase [Euryarchaeota archaeon]HON36211.1 energy-coupling factor transporter ATPase [Methanothrix sp.]HRT16480.1 energy-coupling factor transporter ATPase [Methanothrix sp.]